MSFPAQLLSGQQGKEVGNCQPGYFHNWCNVEDDDWACHAVSDKWSGQFWGEGSKGPATYGGDIHIHLPEETDSPPQIMIH